MTLVAIFIVLVFLPSLVSGRLERTFVTAALRNRAPWDWRMLLNGHGNKLLLERGMFVTNLPLAELKHWRHVKARARAADQAADFSRLIRQVMPGIEL